MHFIIFDLDGTLTQTYYAQDKSFMRALGRFIPVESDYPYWKECVHLTDEAVFQQVFLQITGRAATEEDKAKMQDQFLVELMHKFKHTPGFFDPIPGAQRFIKELKQDPQVVLGVSTGGWEKIARFKLELAGYNVAEFHLIGSDAHPDKYSFTKTLIERVGQQHDFKQITYIGDSLYDYESAKALGLSFIGIDYLETGQFNNHLHLPIYSDFRDVIFLG